MLNYNLDSFESAGKFIKMCDKYKGRMEIDVICGRQNIDAYSMLGVHSLIGHIVSVDPLTTDEDLKKEFAKDLENIK